jgi:lipid II:glycine glycyltransferase (peptidoglycan interpeptide bridge formation enzyme)
MANFARVESSVRRAIRKADQSSLSVEISSSPESARAFYDLLRLTRRRHGLPPQPISFFQNIQRHVLSLGLGSIVLAKLNHQAVAGALFVRSGKKAIFKFGASDERHQQHRPNNLVMWRAIEWLANSGCTSLDFGRTSLANTGLRQYKLGWGTAEAELQYYRFDMRNSAFVTDKDDSIGWHNRVFRLLPLPVSRLAGEFAYRHLA